MRVADANGNFDTSRRHRVGERGAARARTPYQKDFISKYMDPTEIDTRMDRLAAQYPNIMQAIELPNKTGRLPAAGHGGVAGNTAGDGTPSGALAP